MAELIFYTNPMSRGRIVRWMLEEVGAPYETVVLDYAASMKAAPYLAINPMGKVPALTHGGAVVTEVPAICAYLADAFPEADLAPALGDRAAYFRWLFFAAGPIEQAVIEHRMGIVPTPDQQRMVGYGSYDLTVEVLEAAVTGRTYVAGDRFSAADVVIGSQIGWGTQFGTLPKLPGMMAYLEGLQAREGFQRAKALDDAATAAAAAQ